MTRPTDTNSKPLFIPLKKEHFEAFERKEKVNEYRPYGPRWNEKTCYHGRKAVISCGYGKKRRMKGWVYKASLCQPSEAFVRIYGPDKQCFAIQLADLEAV